MQVCGIKLEIAKPRAGNPKQGFIVPNLTLAPICHPQFRPGPPSEEAQVRSLCFKFTLNPLKFSPLRETDTKKVNDTNLQLPIQKSHLALLI